MHVLNQIWHATLWFLERSSPGLDTICSQYRKPYLRMLCSVPFHASLSQARLCNQSSSYLLVATSIGSLVGMFQGFEYLLVFQQCFSFQVDDLTR